MKNSFHLFIFSGRKASLSEKKTEVIKSLSRGCGEEEKLWQGVDADILFHVSLFDTAESS